MENTQVLERENTGEADRLEFVEKPVYDFFKRVFDIVCSAIALVVLSPLIIVISLMICIKDFGSPFYTQTRIGLGEKQFKMYKLRSMYKNADKMQEQLKEASGVTDVSLKLEHDPRVIKGMDFIRKYSIDELMQLLNVLKGDMTIIGPRPLPTYEYDEVKDNPHYKPRYMVKQGLSCYWQIYRTKDTTFDERMEMDLQYVKDRSFLADIKIIFKTIGVVLGHKNY
ncbi:MAG: sugar transferase [Oscillospiraceae bacterium]